MPTQEHLSFWTEIDLMTARTSESFGRRLARLRKERGITQVELAESAGISQPNISGYERDLVRPTVEMVIVIAKILKVSVDELLLGEKKKTPEPIISRRLLKRVIRIQSLSKRDQQALLRTIDAFLAKSA